MTAKDGAPDVLADVRRRPTAGWLAAAGSFGAAGQVSYPSATSS